jgi:hypothetical protein
VGDYSGNNGLSYRVHREPGIRLVLGVGAGIISIDARRQVLEGPRIGNTRQDDNRKEIPISTVCRE